MNTNLSYRQRLLGVLSAVAILLGLLAPTPAHLAQAAGNPNPRVLPPNSHPYGYSYEEWAGKWWQWVAPIPVHDANGNFLNPAFDTTGEHCAEGQSGPVWYLAGTFLGGPTTRNCTVPTGKAILFPIFTVECSVVEPDPFHGNNEAELRSCARGFTDLVIHSVTDLEASVDGRELTDLFSSYRFTSPLINPLEYAEENVLFVPGPGITQSVADGFYVMLAPLPPGQHTIQFATADGFQNVTYNLTVR